MERLTHKRSNGIKEGYWSPNKKEELVKRLAEYENTGLSPADVEELRRQQDRCRWIPVGERLPSEKEFLKAYCRNHYAAEFLVMIKDATRPTTLYFLKDTKSWVDDERNHYTILAWQPIPEPYKGGQNET